MEKNHQDQSEVKGKTYMRYACLVWFLVRIKHLYFLVVYMYLGMAPGTYTKGHVFRRDWTTCSETDNHSQLNGQHNWMELTWPLNEHENLHFGNE